MKNSHLPFVLVNILLSFFLINCSQKSDAKLNEDDFLEEMDDRNTSTVDQSARTPDCSNYFDAKTDGGDFYYVYLGTSTMHLECPYWEEKFDEFLKGIDSEEQKIEKIDNYKRLTAYVQSVYKFLTLEEAKADYDKYNKKRNYIERISKDLNSNKENFQRNNWTTNDKNIFKKDCLNGLVEANSQLSSTRRNEYCDCVQEKIIREYPDKYSKQDFNWIKNTAKECLIELINE